MTTIALDTKQAWIDFLEFVKQRTSPAAFGNWLSPIVLIEASDEEIHLQVRQFFDLILSDCSCLLTRNIKLFYTNQRIQYHASFHINGCFHTTHMQIHIL